ncbi:uncharacterized protein LOC124704191 isoform X1 [Lolium rigidum]|uniref:uncharacterized protein LOC124704191 isoform X1 n=1 Tax=Lolium rigidum TaxID=89674 RepID=UPI001F5C85BF|nr:uncharacterized protein LOC124704191 isoform X1 [Lolium rigidum]
MQSVGRRRVLLQLPDHIFDYLVNKDSAGCRSVCTVWVQIYFQAFFGLENVTQAVDEVAATASSYSDFLCAFCVPIESRSPCCSSNEPCPDLEIKKEGSSTHVVLNSFR